MDYIIDFCIGSALYLSVLLFYYSRERKAPSKRQKLYKWLLAAGLCALLLDIACVLLERMPVPCPYWFSFCINFLFLFSVQVNGPMFLFYISMLVGSYRQLSRLSRTLMLLPIAVVLVLLGLSAFGTYGIFYFDADGRYCHGASHPVLYVVMALYIVMATVMMLRRHGSITSKKEYTVYALVAVTLAVMAVQYCFPNYLINSSATAVAITMMYYAIQPPGEHIDPMTGAINRAGLLQMISELSEQGQEYTLLVFPIQTIQYVNRGMGFEAGDKLLCQFADCLVAGCSDKQLARVDGTTFAMLGTDRRETLTPESLRELRAELQKAIDAAAEIPPHILLGGYSGAAGDTADYALHIADKLTEELLAGCPEQVLYADEVFRTRVEYNTKAEAALERAISGEGLEVYYQPINRPDGSIAAMEALCRIRDAELGYIPPDLFIQMAERSGRIHQLGEEVLHLVCRFIRDNGIEGWALEHVGVNLSAAQCMREGFGERTAELVRSYGIPEGLLAFELTETAAMTELSAVQRNMETLSRAGFGLLLDDFGSGFANFDYIGNLPFSCIKLDKTLLWQAQHDEGQMTLLHGVCRIVSDMGLPCICEGVETSEQAELLQKLGVARYQGYYFSRPLPPSALLEYAAAHKREAKL